MTTPTNQALTDALRVSLAVWDKYDPDLTTDKIIRRACVIVDQARALVTAADAGGEEPPAQGEEDEAYELGKRDGFEAAIQLVDQRTGGDGEYFASTIPGRGCPDWQTMLGNIVERFAARSQAQGEAITGESGALREALETARAIAVHHSNYGHVEGNNRAFVIAADIERRMATLQPPEPTPEQGWDGIGMLAGDCDRTERASSPSETGEAPVAWRYEVATDDGVVAVRYSANMPVGDVLDLRPLYAQPRPTEAPVADVAGLVEGLREYARSFQHGEKAWPREFVENALANHDAAVSGERG